MIPSSGGASRPEAVTRVIQTGRVLTVIGAHDLHDAYTATLPLILPAFICKAEAGQIADVLIESRPPAS